MFDKHFHSPRIQRSKLLPLIVILLLLAGCGTSRNAKLMEQRGVPALPEFKAIRFYGDTVPKDIDKISQEWAKMAETTKGGQVSFLSLSGGGADGAFGAGFLCGWSSQGDRPAFDMVTGVSTGALIAPFAFLGPEHDKLIERLYTTFSTKNIATTRPIGSALAGDSIMSTEPLQQVLKTYISAEVIEQIAREYRKGRMLIIGTTNLDEMRPVYWDIGRIAQHPSEAAHQLIRNVILASASIPVAFPPVYFKVRSAGKTYAEMHVDGGVTNQVFSYPPSIHLAEELEKIGEKRKIVLYVIRNDALVTEGVQVEPYIGGIAARSLAGLIRNQGIGDLYRMYYTSQRDGIDFKLTFIPPDYNEESDEMFSPVYMSKLFVLGHSMAKAPSPWHAAPPSTTARKGPDAVPAEVIFE